MIDKNRKGPSHYKPEFTPDMKDKKDGEEFKEDIAYPKTGPQPTKIIK